MRRGVPVVLRSTVDARGRRVALRCAAATVLVVLAGCSAGNGTDTPAASTPPAVVSAAPSPTTTITPADMAGQAALDAYRGMWRDFVQAGTSSDWQSPLLGQHATGIALTNLSRGLYADHYNGLVTKGEPILNPVVASAEPADGPIKVVVTDCGDSTGWLKYRAKGGGPVEGSPGGRRLINAIVEKQPDGSWKVSDYGVQGVGTC
jgi:hypothetical protein